MANNESLKGRQLVCLDAGAEWECYASDGMYFGRYLEIFRVDNASLIFEKVLTL
jgi:hypothetical protein